MTRQLTRPPSQPQPHNTDLDRTALWRAYQLILSWPKRGEVQPASGAAVDRAEAKPQPRQEGEQ